MNSRWPLNTLALGTLLLAAAAGVTGQDLPLHLDFEDADQTTEVLEVQGAGWRSSLSATWPHTGKQSLCLGLREGETSETFGTLTGSLDVSAFRGRRIRLSAAVRTEGGPAQLWLRVDRAEGRVGFFDNMSKRQIHSRSWGTYEVVGEVAEDAETIVFGLLVQAPSGSLRPAAWIDDLSVELAGEGSVPTGGPGPGIVEALGEFEAVVEAAQETPSFQIPLPLTYREQVPLSYALSSVPEGMLKSTQVRVDPLGNAVATVVLQPMRAGEAVAIRWRSLILCGPRSLVDLPQTAPFPERWPDEARPWLADTFCVGTSDRGVQEHAEALGTSDDVLQVLDLVLAQAKRAAESVEGKPATLDLTAAGALRGPESCTSRANLVAALIRAKGIPARVLAGYPTWSGPLQTHYVVEAWVPGYGWYAIESTLLKKGWPAFQQVNVSIVPPEHEDQRAGRRASGVAGVPYLSLTELGLGLRAVGRVAPTSLGCDHLASTWRLYPRDSKAWGETLQLAARAWRGWVQSKSSLDPNGQLQTDFSLGPQGGHSLKGLAKALEAHLEE